MVHAYHLVMGLYGFWLPNDPRGSWSEFVGAWELLRFGRTTRRFERGAKLTPEELVLRAEAKQGLKYPPVILTGAQARSVAHGFGTFCRKNRLTPWACAILPEHVHLVIPRFRYDIEQVAILLKGAGTRQLRADQLDPMAAHGTTHAPWARGQWSVFLENEEAIEEAIRYVEENPEREGKRRQRWSFVKPFYGLDEGVVTYG